MRMSYQTLILLRRDSGASLRRACESLEQSGAFHASILSLRSDHIALDFADWRLSIRLASGAHVIEESRDIVQRYGSDRDDQAVLATCDTRFELDGGADPDMEHFNDYVLIVERLTDAFRGVAFECHTEQFV